MIRWAVYGIVAAVVVGLLVWEGLAFAKWRGLPTITAYVRDRNSEPWMQFLVFAVIVGSAIWSLNHLLGGD